MASVSIHEAKTHLSALISRIERLGEKIIISKHGRAVAELGPISPKSRLKVSKKLKDIKIKEDPTLPTHEEWDNV